MIHATYDDPHALDPLRQTLLSLARVGWYLRELWTTTEGEPGLADALEEFGSSVAFVIGLPSFADLNTPPFYAKMVALKERPSDAHIGLQGRLGGVWATVPQDESRAIVVKPNVQILAATIHGERRYAPSFVGPEGSPFADHPAYPRWWFTRAFDACLVASLVFAMDFDTLYSPGSPAYAADFSHAASKGIA